MCYYQFTIMLLLYCTLALNTIATKEATTISTTTISSSSTSSIQTMPDTKTVNETFNGG